MSPDPGHATAELEPDELLSLISMYTTAVGELVDTGDPGVGQLARELLMLRAEAIGTLTQRGPDRGNGAGELA